MKNIVALAVTLLAISFAQAQENKWAFGLYGDMQVEKPDYNGSFGVQAKYDLDNYQALQAQVHGRGDMVAIGADYLFNVLNKGKSKFNIFLGPGFSQEFFTYNFTTDGNVSGPIRHRENHSKAVGQVGLSYYFPEVKLSLYTGYKLKYDIKNEITEPNFLMLGVRYHIW